MQRLHKNMDQLIRRWYPYSNENQRWPQILIIFAVSLNSIAFGSLFSWTSPSIPILISNSSHLEPFSIEAVSYFTVIPPLAFILSAPVVVAVVEKLGRSKTVALISLPQILSWLLIIFAKDISTIYISRFLEGIGEALYYTSVPTYVGEISVPKVRGTWGNLISLGFYIGQFLVNVFGNFYDIKITACILISIPILQFLIAINLPESPYFLLMKGKRAEAKNSLQKLRWKGNVEEELNTLTKDVRRQISESGCWKDLFNISANFRLLLIAIGIRTAQQFSGYSVFSVYTQYIFNQAGGDLSSSASTLTFTGSLIVFIFIFSTLTDKFGRRRSMIFSCFGCGVATAIETVYFYICEKTEWNTINLGWIPITGMFLYIIVCAAGLGILPTLMLSELFSASVKSKAICITNVFYSIDILVCSKLFQMLSVNFGMYIPFALFTICSFVSVIFSYFCVPETKGRTLEEIQQDFKKK